MDFCLLLSIFCIIHRIFYLRKTLIIIQLLEANTWERQHLLPTYLKVPCAKNFYKINKQTNKCSDNNNSKTSALAELHELLYWFVIHRYRLGIFE